MAGDVRQQGLGIVDQYKEEAKAAALDYSERCHPLPEIFRDFCDNKWAQLIRKPCQKSLLYAHFGGLTGPALGDVVIDGTADEKLLILYLEFLNENKLIVAINFCRFWLCTNPVACCHILIILSNT